MSCTMLFRVKYCQTVAVAALQHCREVKFEQTAVLHNPQLTTLKQLSFEFDHSLTLLAGCQ